MDKRRDLLFTPGPLTVSKTVKEAMMHDYGSRDAKFLTIVDNIRQRLLKLAGLSDQEDAEDDRFVCVLLQGSGTYAVEAVLNSIVPRDGKILLIINGSYGKRMIQMCERASIAYVPVAFPETTRPTAAQVSKAMQENPDITHVAIVHHETTSGILNSLEEINELRTKFLPNAEFIVDAMSSFGGIAIDFKACGVDYLVTSPNKCLQGVPGFGIVFARRSALFKSEGNARTLSLDVLAQLRGFEKNGQFRYTPPTHCVAALSQALDEMEVEGGISARFERYKSNQAIVRAGFEDLGFKQLLPDGLQGPFITSVVYPESPKWDFETFYTKLAGHGFILYPGKVTVCDSFRVGNIGDLFNEDMQNMIAASKTVLEAMGMK